MTTSRRAVPYTLLAIATLAILSLPLGLRAVASPADPAASGPASPRALTPSAAPLDAVRLTGPVVLWTGATATYAAFGPAVSGKAVSGRAYSALSSAASAAATWSFPPPGQTGQISQGPLCLTIPAGAPGTPVTATTCGSSPAQQISLVASANGAALRSAASATNFVDFSPSASAFQTHVQDRGDGVQTSLLKPAGQAVLSVATVTKGAVGTATVSGRGTPGAAVLNGTQSARVGTDGRWSMTVVGADPAGATVRFAQSINGQLYTHADAVITAWPVRPAAPVAETFFPDDITQDAIVRGKGQTGATVEVRSGDSVIGSATVVAGTWSTSIASLGSGEHPLSVTQTATGLQSPPRELSIDYGAAVSITEPADGTTTS